MFTRPLPACANTTTGNEPTRWYNQFGVGVRYQGVFGPLAVGAYGFYEYAAIEKVKESVKSEDAASINRAVEDLQRASQAMAEHLYAAGGTAGAGAATGEAAGPGASSGDGSQSGKADDVIDVEFEEKK